MLDFGVSKSTDPLASGHGALTRTSAILGSPLYMAPEQMRSSRDVDARADVWALGVVLFELLTRRWPFEAETLPALCLKVVGDPPQSLTDFRSDLPEELIDIVETCLAKDPAERYGNAAELSSALEPLLPVGARILAERARLAISSAAPALPSRIPSRTLDAFATPSKMSPRSVSARRAAPTPAAWGSSNSASAKKKKKTRTATLLGVAALAGVAILGVVGFALRDRPSAEEGKTSRAAALGAPDLAPSANRPPAIALAPPPSETTPAATAIARASASPGVTAAAPNAIDAGLAVVTAPAAVRAPPAPVAPAFQTGRAAGAAVQAAPAPSK